MPSRPGPAALLERAAWMRTLVDRIARAVVGYQRWDRVLFLHWPVPADALRPLVDRRLDLDPFEGRAYVSLTPFTVRGARLRGLPPVPRLSEFHEVNLRTYVRLGGGDPGIWFFGLDAASAAASAAARAVLGLPYFAARMERSVAGEAHEYRSVRVGRGAEASLRAEWNVGEPVPHPPGSLDHFLAERYALYSVLAGRLLRLRVRHPPWALAAARLERLEETLRLAAGVPAAPEPPLARFSDGVDVELFSPELVG